MRTLRKCSKGFVVVGKTDPAQGNQKRNGAYTGIGVTGEKLPKAFSLEPCVVQAQKAVCATRQAKLFKMV